MICENCNSSHDGSYGAGRFCSPKCARSFATSKKRNDINKKISKIISSKKRFITKKCLWCNESFSLEWKRRNQKTCSRSCGSKLTNSRPEVRDKLSKSRIENLKENKNKPHKLIFNFNGKEIKCDSKIEYACLDYFVKNFNPKDMKRCMEHVSYLDTTTNKKRRYLPDFIIITNDKEYIVECKGYAGKSLNGKWRKYNELSDIKKEVLKEYARNTNRESFWFTKDIHRKFYENMS